MVLVKVYDDYENHYFSSKAKAAQWLEVYNQQINYALKYEKEVKGWKVCLTDDPDVRNCEIDDFNG